MTHPNHKHLTVLGECVADAFTIPDLSARSDALTLRILPGGGPANTAVALARLGTPTRFLGRISHDVFGTLFRNRLTASGVDLTGSVTAPEGSTLAVADLDDHGHAAYSFFADGAADWQWTDAELAAAPLDDTICLHTGSLALIREPGGPRIEEFLTRAGRHATVSVDPNVRPLLVEPAAYGERLARWCTLADILRLSEDDLALLLPGATPEQACDTWHAAGVPLVVITLGKRGTAGLLHRLAAHGCLGGRLDALSLHEVVDACSYAARVAARTCSVPGADPPWADQLTPESTALPTG